MTKYIKADEGSVFNADHFVSAFIVREDFEPKGDKEEKPKYRLHLNLREGGSFFIGGTTDREGLGKRLKDIHRQLEGRSS